MMPNIAAADALSKVAPVYFQAADRRSSHGFEVEEKLAVIVGREAAYASCYAQYRDRLAEVRAGLPAVPPGSTYLAIFVTDQINVVGPMSGLVQAMEDLGYTRLAIGEERRGGGDGGALIVPIGADALGSLDPGLLILMNSFIERGRDAAAVREALDRVLPGWQRFLPAARENRVLCLDSAEVGTPTIASAIHTLDALLRRASPRGEATEGAGE